MSPAALTTQSSQGLGAGVGRIQGEGGKERKPNEALVHTLLTWQASTKRKFLSSLLLGEMERREGEEKYLKQFTRKWRKKKRPGKKLQGCLL